MKGGVFYRIAAVLLVLFAAGHTLGFRQIDPKWGVDGPIRVLQATQFEAQGAKRTYWDFYSGFGLFVSVLLGFAALVAWQLAGERGHLPAIHWGFVATFGAVTFLSWRYFFVAPVVFSLCILGCLTAGALKWRR